MRKKGQSKPPAVIGPPNDPGSLYHQMLQFLQWMHERNYSPRTADNREVYLRYFILWCDERGLTRPQEITRPILERYQRYMFLYRKKDGQPLSTRSQGGRVLPIRAWFKWMTKTNRILYNPAADLDMPRQEHRLPKHILTAEEADRIMNMPDIRNATGLRDRAILETLYSTGIRRMEVIGLGQHDIDYERGTLIVRQGKGKKDRMIPIGDRALAWIRKYRDEVRSQVSLPGGDDMLFLTQFGEELSRYHLTKMVRDYIDAAKIGKRGSCHLFRHTMATLMLENGADIRFIQAMLGHAELSTTQIYTQVSIVKLKEIHTLTHPARLARITRAETSTDDPNRQADAEDPAAAPLDALDEESKEEDKDDGEGQA